MARRVLVLKRGKLSFDGTLQEVLNVVSTDKIITVTTTSLSNVSWLKHFGSVHQKSAYSFQITVPRQDVNAAIQAIIQNQSISDISLHDLPIEDAIHYLLREEG